MDSAPNPTRHGPKFFTLNRGANSHRVAKRQRLSDRTPTSSAKRNDQSITYKHVYTQRRRLNSSSNHSRRSKECKEIKKKKAQCMFFHYLLIQSCLPCQGAPARSNQPDNHAKTHNLSLNSHLISHGHGDGSSSPDDARPARAGDARGGGAAEKAVVVATGAGRAAVLVQWRARVGDNIEERTGGVRCAPARASVRISPLSGAFGRCVRRLTDRGTNERERERERAQSGARGLLEMDRQRSARFARRGRPARQWYTGGGPVRPESIVAGVPGWQAGIRPVLVVFDSTIQIPQQDFGILCVFSCMLFPWP